MKDQAPSAALSKHTALHIGATSVETPTYLEHSGRRETTSCLTARSACSYTPAGSLHPPAMAQQVHLNGDGHSTPVADSPTLLELVVVVLVGKCMTCSVVSVRICLLQDPKAMQPPKAGSVFVTTSPVFDAVRTGC